MTPAKQGTVQQPRGEPGQTTQGDGLSHLGNGFHNFQGMSGNRLPMPSFWRL
jgi:hypothetical protein